MKRGSSGLSLVVGVNKPCGMTSHDVVSRCRTIFAEKRVGHMGTLDPLASGVLIVCVGSATRLDKYLVGHDKSYCVDVAFGAATETDDAEGSIIKSCSVPAALHDINFARVYAQTLVGKTMQTPPQYSALKVQGKKACDQARKGNVVELAPRAIEIYAVEVQDVIEADDMCPYLRWRLEVRVSKGAYIRAFARDLGAALGTVAHVTALRRVRSGALSVNQCVTLEALEDVRVKAACDPLPLLAQRFAYLSDAAYERLSHGAPLYSSDITLMEEPQHAFQHKDDCCFPLHHESSEPPCDNECISLVYNNKLAAIYRFNSSKDRWKADCVFSPSVIRRSDSL